MAQANVELTIVDKKIKYAAALSKRDDLKLPLT